MKLLKDTKTAKNLMRAFAVNHRQEIDIHIMRQLLKMNVIWKFQICF